MTRGPRIALVTGAGSGIGRVSSISISMEGFAVVRTGGREDALLNAEAEIVDGGGKALAIAAQISRPSVVERPFETVSSRSGLLFNNAGTSTGGTPLAARQDLAAPIIAAFRPWLEAQLSRIPRSSKLAEDIR